MRPDEIRHTFAVSKRQRLTSSLVAAVAVLLPFGGLTASPVVASAPSFTPLLPARLLDSRAGATTIDGLQAGTGAAGPGATVNVTVTGRGGVPTLGVGAVVVNVTAVAPTTAGYVTVYPAGQPRPLSSNLNFTPGQTIPNLVIAKVGTGGQISLYNSSGATDLVVDVLGWYSDSGFALPVPPSPPPPSPPPKP